MADFTPTERTQVHRLPKRGVYDREAVYRILDEGLVCHVGFVADGKPVVIPTGYGRQGDTLYIHGSTASRMFRALGKGADVCITVTLVDGLVLARSAFHHSMNYRSVVIFGKATVLEDPAAKREALQCLPSTWRAGGGRKSASPPRRNCRPPPFCPFRWKKFPPRCAPARRLTTKKTTRCPSGRESCPLISPPKRPFLTPACPRKFLSPSMCESIIGNAGSFSLCQSERSFLA